MTFNKMSSFNEDVANLQKAADDFVGLFKKPFIKICERFIKWLTKIISRLP